MKFRAWDVEEKCWIPENQLAMTASGELLTYDLEEDRWAIDPICWVHSRGSEKFDRHGREIFEGDVLRVDELTFKSSAPLPDVLTVTYDQDAFELYRGIQPLFGLRLTYAKTCEVIGNIYENPELLTK